MRAWHAFLVVLVGAAGMVLSAYVQGTLHFWFSRVDEEQAHTAAARDLARELFDVTRQTQVLQEELLRRTNPELAVPTSAELQLVKEQASTGQQSEPSPASDLAVDLLLARSQLEATQRAWQSYLQAEQQDLEQAVAEQQQLVQQRLEEKLLEEQKSIQAQHEIEKQRRQEELERQRLQRQEELERQRLERQREAERREQSSRRPPPPPPLLTPPADSMVLVDGAMVPGSQPPPTVPLVVPPSPPQLPPAALVAPVDGAMVLGTQPPPAVSVSERSPTPPARSMPSMSSVAIDFSCGKHSNGKDPCACQISCRTASCSNAQATCDKLGAQCQTMRTNNSQKNKIATLKKVSTFEYELPAERRAWEQRFGQGEGVVLIIGEQKCGTTLLYDLLRAHPDIGSPKDDRKELHMFDHYHHLDECRLGKFLEFFRNRDSSRVYLADATPDYLADPVAAALVASLLPKAKVIVLLREPSRRAHAAWDQNRRAGSETRTFAQAVKDELPAASRCRELSLKLAGAGPIGSGAADQTYSQYVQSCALFFDGMPGNCWVNRRYDEQPPCKRYLYKGFYGPHLQFWRNHFAPEQLLVVQAETLFANQAGVLAQVEDFIGVRPSNRRQLRAGSGSTATKECWHDCKKPKRKFEQDVHGALARTLKDLYDPTDTVLMRLLNDELRWINS